MCLYFTETKTWSFWPTQYLAIIKSCFFLSGIVYKNDVLGKLDPKGEVVTFTFTGLEN